MKAKPTLADILVGQRIKGRRLGIVVGVQGIADQVGIARQQMERYEDGIDRIPASRIPQIAAALKVTLGYLLDGVNLEPSSLEVSALTDDQIQLLLAYDDIPDRSARRHLLEIAEAISASPV
jgi:transcriptional regulator with XRE-family HTH domain